MVPKNKRFIPPWWLIKVLNLFNSSSEDREWDSKVKELLETKHLKRDFGSYHKNPGGDRTYKSQLECLGLIFTDEEKNLQLTKAGRDLVGSHPEPLLILQKMLLRLQYPSAYSVGHNVAISEEVTVRPFLFLIALIDELGHLTTEEIGVAVVYGHNHNMAFQRCINKIKELRSGSTFREILDSEDDLWTTRIKDNPIEDKIKYATDDIPNIFENYLESARLIERTREDIGLVSRLTSPAKNLLSQADTELIEYSKEEVKDNKIAFQRRFGAWDGSKDTRRTERSEPIKDPEELLIKNEFIEFLSEGIREQKELDEFREKMHKLGLDADKVNEIIAKLNSLNTSLFEDRFHKIATGGAKHAREFEESIVRLLRRIGFEAHHTGDLKRPSGSGGYADAYFSYDNKAYLFDAKASEYYSISHSELTKAVHTYIPNWYELCNEHGLPEAELLKLFGYIAGGYKKSGDLEKKLSEISENSDVQTAALTAWDFFKYVQKNDNCSKKDFLDKILKGGRLKLN
jgi:hypothetical protein